jgi:formylglycine-generating enzyme
MAWISGGTFLMGSDHHCQEEAPAHRVTVDGFWMDRHLVTNAEFARFVRQTGHVTVAERPPNPADYPGAKPDMLIAASTVFRPPPYRVDLRNHYNWWTYVPGGTGATRRGRAAR